MTASTLTSTPTSSKLRELVTLGVTDHSNFGLTGDDVEASAR